MVLWIVFAVLALLTLALVCRPLLASGEPAVGGSDEVVYAAQLEEIETDRANGTIGEEEAKAARTEVARRLLRAHREAGEAAAIGRRRWVVAAILVVLIPAVTVAGYLTLGMPGYGDRPLAERQQTSGTDVAELLSQAEARLAAHPEEGEGWAAIAPMYLRLTRFADAAEAYRRAIDLLGEDARLLTGRGQALMFAGGGTVPDEAVALFERASALEPEAVAPRVFLAVADRQRGDLGAAAKRWASLLESSDGTENWLPLARSEIAALQQTDAAAGGTAAAALAAQPGAGPRIPAAQQGGPNPSSSAAAAIAALPAEQRAAQIEGMVEGLAARLEADGGSVDEWVRLVRSYRVLGRDEDAAAARTKALAALDETDRAAFTQAVGPATDGR
ncbi:c-type cytochrome biogenesis protein CcmI [Acuticoccus sediminis]|uniref:C-type cytochrome biogenesis protein CcmI n=1 Tax=Acuticoccus sediminis TaxID=2184697 RepID=A0A8B2NRR6_9HYPH|nr:c-type cytochrome biogenesis protein CcmI [Acuticoccus sediminis]RAI01000.1 c-type cytochrome biogenesis protein CcmI [Acuticoccus sediminis]